MGRGASGWRVEQRSKKLLLSRHSPSSRSTEIRVVSCMWVRRKSPSTASRTMCCSTVRRTTLTTLPASARWHPCRDAGGGEYHPCQAIRYHAVSAVPYLQDHNPDRWEVGSAGTAYFLPAQLYHGIAVFSDRLCRGNAGAEKPCGF